MVAIFVFLCLSTGYSLKNDYVDDEVLDMLQETDNLKEAPEMVSCNAFAKFRSCFDFSAIFLYISQNFIMARFAAFEGIKLHQILKPASTSP